MSDFYDEGFQLRTLSKCWERKIQNIRLVSKQDQQQDKGYFIDAWWRIYALMNWINIGSDNGQTYCQLDLQEHFSDKF